jgi:hypothetical protein
MDPVACLQRIADALEAGPTGAGENDLEDTLIEARDAAADLRAWLAGGGFAPRLTPEAAYALEELASVALGLLRGEL